MRIKVVNNFSKRESDYNNYIEEHKANVKKGFNWLCNNLPEVITEHRREIEDNIQLHDMTKYNEAEFKPYADYFYGEKTEEVEKAFNYAWLHHIHNNPHHWQYWILTQDEDADMILDMPYQYIVEMICDWWAFSWKSGNLYEIFDWYKKQTKMKLSDETRRTVEILLDKIKSKLDEGKI